MYIDISFTCVYIYNYIIIYIHNHIHTRRHVCKYPMECNVLSCNVMQCNDMYCTVMQGNATKWNRMECTVMNCNVLQCHVMQWNAMCVLIKYHIRFAQNLVHFVLERRHLHEVSWSFGVTKGFWADSKKRKLWIWSCPSAWCLEIGTWASF